MLLKESTLRISAQQALGMVAIYMLRVQPVLLDVALGKRFIQELLKEDLIDCLMQRYVRSKDGEVDIPLLILTQNSTANGSSSYPTLLYGYGGQSLQAIQRSGINAVLPVCQSRQLAQPTSHRTCVARKQAVHVPYLSIPLSQAWTSKMAWPCICLPLHWSADNCCAIPHRAEPCGRNAIWKRCSNVCVRIQWNLCKVPAKVSL